MTLFNFINRAISHLYLNKKDKKPINYQRQISHLRASGFEMTYNINIASS